MGTMLDKVLMKFCQLQITMTVRFTSEQYRFSLVYDFTTTKPTQGS
jgi:hypothetical protein